MKKILYSLIALFILTPNLFSETIKLWHGKNAGLGAEAVTLTIHLPKKTLEKTSAVIICPGGGYGTCVMTYEGNEVGEWFAARGH